MLFATALFLFAAVSASARSLDGRAATVTHPLKRRGNPTSIRDVVEKGRARVSSIDSQNTGSILARANAANGPGVASVTDFHENIVYGVMLTIGSQTYNLIVDTGCEWPKQAGQGPKS